MTEIETIYRGAGYEPLEPEEANSYKYTYKFNSLTHYLAYVKALDKNFARKSRMRNSEEGEFSFSLSRSLEDAYQVIANAKFSAETLKTLESSIKKIRKESSFSDDGFELEIPEYLAGSERPWLKGKSTNKKTKVIDDMLFIQANYNWHINADVVVKMGQSLITKIYQKGVIPRKLVVFYATKSIDNAKGVCRIFIDVSFSDLNGLVQTLHPATFRRLGFRIKENYPSLSSGYGSADNQYTTKGIFGFETTYGVCNTSTGEIPDGYIDNFLGLKTYA